MCPDKETLSVYFDGEVDSPIKEKIEAHLRECPACRAQMEAFRRLRQTLKAGDEPAEAVSASLERVHQRMGHQEGPARYPDVWHRRINIPLPAAAAAVLVLFLGGLMVSGGFSRGTAGPDVAQTGSLSPGEPSQAIEWETQDLEALLGILESEEAFYQEVEWKLPADRQISVGGESRLIREVDYRGQGAPR